VSRLIYLYWIHDDSCLTVRNDGYVGVTVNLKGRIKRHRSNFKDKGELHATILYIGTNKDCLKREFDLRPTRNIGWNTAPGGQKSRLGMPSPLKGRPNPNASLIHKGRTPWNKGKKMNKAFCKMRSRLMAGKSNPKIGATHVTRVCPNCLGTFRLGMFGRWHGPRCRISLEDASTIINSRGIILQRELAEQFGVSKFTIQKIQKEAVMGRSALPG
jgi:hypothetical protein